MRLVKEGTATSETNERLLARLVKEGTVASET